MDEKILVICLSRGRPDQCREMIDSFNATSKMSSLKIYLDQDDPEIYKYEQAIGSRASYTKGTRPRTTTDLINENWRSSSQCFRWFSVTNDDFVYKTEGWDLELIRSLNGKPGIIYGNDLLQGVNMPTTSVISREIVEAVGWLQMPTLIHLYGDNVWKHLGQRAECLYYRPDVIIEHRHFFARKAVEDITYKITNSTAMYDDDKANFIKWIYTQAPADVEKIKILVEKYYTKPAPSSK